MRSHPLTKDYVNIHPHALLADRNRTRTWKGQVRICEIKGDEHASLAQVNVVGKRQMFWYTHNAISGETHEQYPLMDYLWCYEDYSGENELPTRSQLDGTRKNRA